VRELMDIDQESPALPIGRSWALPRIGLIFNGAGSLGRRNLTLAKMKQLFYFLSRTEFAISVRLTPR
jgi:hypothetical protein